MIASGFVRRDLLDVDAPLAGDHDERLAGRAVDHHAEVVLVGDVGRRRHEHLAHRQPLDLHAEDRLGLLLRLRGRRGQLDPARLAAPAGVDLRLDDDPPP